MNNLKNRPLNFATIRDQAQGRWREIFSALAPELHSAMERAPHHGPCPSHGGADGFRLFRDFHINGGGICNTCVNPQTGRHGFSSGFDLLAWHLNTDLRNTFERVQNYIEAPAFNHTMPAAPAPQPVKNQASAKSERYQAYLAKRIRSTWSDSISVTAPVAEPVRLYLANRGIHVSSNTLSGLSLRFHPCLDCWEGMPARKVGSYPAMVAAVLTASGKLTTLHVTYLTPDGQKAPVAKPKKILSHPDSGQGLLRGGALRLTPPSDILGIGEGIETMLAVREVTGEAVWAAYSASMLANFEPPSGVHTVHIWADRDRKGTGQEAAKALATRLREQGCTVEILLPPRAPAPNEKSVDWRDIVEVEGPNAFPYARVLPPKLSMGI